jgi:7,8-dihydro-6-hydroxymethylpterin-pyrophosphokinase
MKTERVASEYYQIEFWREEEQKWFCNPLAKYDTNWEAATAVDRITNGCRIVRILEEREVVQTFVAREMSFGNTDKD